MTQNSFPVDGDIIRILPSASASVKNQEVQLPKLYEYGNERYIEMRVNPNSVERGEVSLIKRIPIENITPEEWEELKEQYKNLDLNLCITGGISKGLENIEDTRYQRLFIALLTYLNPRQVAIVLHLYRKASEQTNSASPIVTFRTNELLESLGYKRQKDGSFQSSVRSQLHCDLFSLHQIELVLARSFKQEQGEAVGAEVLIKTVLRIEKVVTDNVPRDFDILQAASYTYESADEYTVRLEFFEGIARHDDVVLFPNTINIEQKHGRNAKFDYAAKLRIYLASRLKWDRPDEQQYLTISKTYLLKNLELFGSNSSRNNQILWRTVQELIDEGYIVEARELPGKRRKQPNIQIQVNPEKICAR